MIKMQKLLEYAFTGQDPASLGVMRFLFGFLMVLDIPQERGMSFLHTKWSDPDLCHFPLFDWLQPLPLEWMYIVYSIMFVAALGIMLGFLYRFSCMCFVLSYWYLFFLDKAAWNNHSYLYGLVGLMLLLTDANHYLSIDSLLWPSIRNLEVPRWHYGIFKFQFVLVYFYAGLKKLDHDWVFGFSMTGLSRKWVFDPLRSIGLSNHFIDHFVVHICGLTFDLIQGFLLFFDKTRPLGFLCGSSFHLMNSQMFSIGMFPWTMLATMPIFCYPDWPKKLVGRLPSLLQKVLPTAKQSKKSIICSNAEKGRLHMSQLFVIFVASMHVFVQLVLPYSHSVTKGYNAWTQGLYGYSWDMMVHSWSTQHVVVKIVDSTTGKPTYLRPDAFTTGRRTRRWNSHPDMIKQYAMCVADRIKRSPDIGIREPQIFVDVWRSLNKRFQQRLIDPNVDLVKAPWSPFHDTAWIRPLLTGLTPWRERLREIEAKTYERSNVSDVTFVADFPGLHLENYIDEDVVANLTLLHGNVVVETDDSNTTLHVNDTIRLPSNATHIVYVTSDTPACYLYDSFNVTLNSNELNLEDIDDEFSRKLKEEREWRSKTPAEKLEEFLQRKFALFAFSFTNAARSFKTVISRYFQTGGSPNDPRQ